VYACGSQEVIKGGFWLNLHGADERPELDRQWDRWGEASRKGNAGLISRRFRLQLD
jgi:hypothetical protein